VTEKSFPELDKAYIEVHPNWIMTSENEDKFCVGIWPADKLPIIPNMMLSYTNQFLSVVFWLVCQLLEHQSWVDACPVLLRAKHHNITGARQSKY
jgi:hypothetical protein